jgi:hypothetical protein
MIAVIKTPSRANPPCAWLEMAVSGIVIRWMAGTYSGQLTFKGNSRTESCCTFGCLVRRKASMSKSSRNLLESDYSEADSGVWEDVVSIYLIPPSFFEMGAHQSSSLE